MKKVLTGMLSILMCFTFIPKAYAINEQPNNKSITNEYESIKSLASESIANLSKQGYSSEEIDRIKDYKNIFTEHFNKLKNLPTSELLNAGYTNEQIDILRDFRGTENEINRLAATVTLTIPIEYVTWSKSQNRTNAKFKVNFSWSTEPLFATTDVVGINWNDWTLASSSSSVTYRKRVGTGATTTKAATKVNNSGPNSYGLGYKFKLIQSDINSFAKNGSFTITLYNNYNKKDISIYAKYGHNQVSVTPSVFMPGFGSINFNSGISTIKEQWNDRTCS